MSLFPRKIEHKLCSCTPSGLASTDQRPHCNLTSFFPQCSPYFLGRGKYVWACVRQHLLRALQSGFRRLIFPGDSHWFVCELLGSTFPGSSSLWWSCKRIFWATYSVDGELPPSAWTLPARLSSLSSSVMTSRKLRLSGPPCLLPGFAHYTPILFL